MQTENVELGVTYLEHVYGIIIVFDDKNIYAYCQK